MTTKIDIQVDQEKNMVHMRNSKTGAIIVVSAMQAWCAVAEDPAFKEAMENAPIFPFAKTDVANEVEAILIGYGFEKHGEVENAYVMPLAKDVEVLAFMEGSIFCMEMIYTSPYLKETAYRKLVGYLKVKRPGIIQDLLEGFEWLWSPLQENKYAADPA